MKPKLTEAQMAVDRQALEWAWRLHRTRPDDETLAAFGEWMSVPEHAEAFAVCEPLERSVRTLDAGADGEWARWKDEALARASGVDAKVQRLADWHEAIHAHRFRHRQPEVPSRRWPLALAAGFVLALAGSALVGLQLRQAAPRVEYGTGQHTREVLLPDGTRATLDVATTLGYVDSRRARVLELDRGRVYLDVAREPGGREFRVQAGEVRTVVLGTRFQVAHDPRRTEVVLEEGSLRMELAGSDREEMLRPGDRVWLNKGDRGFGRDTTLPKNALAWTRGRLLFADTTLAEAVAEVNRYAGGTQLVLQDPALAGLQVSGSFVAGDAELAAAAWAATLPLSAEHQGDRILLRKK